MQLTCSHHLAGAGRVIVNAPDLPVFITVAEDIEYRSVDILADRGLAAWAGPSGVGGVAFGIEVNRPNILTSLKRTFLRQGSYISGGGSVVSAGRGAVAAGGNITYAATGKGSRVTIDGVERKTKGVGVHISAPLHSTFELKGFASVAVLRNGAECTVEYAEQQGWLGVKR